MIIAVASGKGGTGKTTVAVNLALSITADQQDVPNQDLRILLIHCSWTATWKSRMRLSSFIPLSKSAEM